MKELELLDKALKKKALFLGERIIDVYHYVDPLGKASKDPIITSRHLSTETFEGGVVAAKSHADAICNHVRWHAGGITIRKERWIEPSHLRKLFEVHYEGANVHLPMPKWDEYDVVVICDYGHGMFPKPFRTDSKTYLAINVQTNSGNYGYNLATKYHRCDYLCVDEPEARLATQNRSGPIEDSLHALGKIADKTVITLGKAGAIGKDHQGIVRTTSYTDSVVDTIGAGDAFFAVTALIAEEADMDSLLKIGNAAGAIKSGIVGHRRSITKHELIGLLENAQGKD